MEFFFFLFIRSNSSLALYFADHKISKNIKSIGIDRSENVNSIYSSYKNN